MKFNLTKRYGLGAGLYDVLSFERPVYRVGRTDAISRLDLKPGSRVLDIGCGTGLNFPLIRAAVGQTGHIAGVDSSVSMLSQARRRVASKGWANVELVEADAATVANAVGGAPFDALIMTYSLSIIEDWRQAWSASLDLLAVGGRAAIVDMRPPSGLAIGFAPWAAFAAWTGGSDLHREPWLHAQDDLTDTVTTTHRGGHIVVTVGTKEARRGSGE